MLIGIDAHNLERERTGVGRYLINLLQEWSRLNFQFPISNFQFILYFKDEIPADISKSDLFKYKLLNVRSTAKFMNWDLWRAAKKDKLDILFCPDYRAPILYNGNVAVTLHDISYETHPEWFNWPSSVDKILLKWASKYTAKKAKLIFTPTEFVRNEIIEHYKVSAEKIVVTPLGVDPVLYRPEKFDSPIYKTSATGEIKKKYGIKDKYIFYVGSIFSRRHLPEVIAAFEQLCQRDTNSPHPIPPLEKGRDISTDYQFLIGGKDYTGGQSVNKIVKTTNAKLGREAILRVDFIADNELKLLYGACAFFIWLSDYEGFGLPPLEAMSLGAPVITTDGSSLREVAGDAALLITDNSDAKEIYRAMHKIGRDGALREELIERGKEQAKKFSWKECAEKTLGALVSVKSK